MRETLREHLEAIRVLLHPENRNRLLRDDSIEQHAAAALAILEAAQLNNYPLSGLYRLVPDPEPSA